MWRSGTTRGCFESPAQHPRRPARTLAAPAKTPSTSSTRAFVRHAESTHRTPRAPHRTPRAPHRTFETPPSPRTPAADVLHADHRQRVEAGGRKHVRPGRYPDGEVPGTPRAQG